MVGVISIFLTSILISLLVILPIFWVTSLLKLGQVVREEGPVTHKVKTGTPTMGGLGVVITIFILVLILINIEFHPQYLALTMLFLAFAAIGLADDLLKIFRKQNLGLTFWQKIFLQVFASGIFAIFLAFIGHNLTVTGILKNMGFVNPYLYQLLVIFMIVGSANATNLTDGLDGLLAGCAGIAFLGFSVIAGKMGISEAQVFSLICSGATFAFLFYNFPKAKIFMGDVGSLALGAGLAGLAIILHKELRLIIIGGVFVVEALSVISQVTWYKLFKRRIFRMAPLHHHFELLGWPEVRVVLFFWLAAIILGVIGIYI